MPHPGGGIRKRKNRATGAVSSLWWPRRPLATLGRKPRQGRKAATVSIDAGAEVSRRGYHPPPATLPAAWTHIACAMRPARHEHPRGTPRLPPASGPWLVVGTGRGDGARISTTAAPLRRVSIDAGAEVSRRGYHPPTTTNDQPRSRAAVAPAESNSHRGLSFVPAVATAQRSSRRQAMPGAVSRRGYHPPLRRHDRRLAVCAATRVATPAPPDAASPHRRRDNVRASRSVRAP
ncbi:hypothetical protein NB713_003137 [Xanthomonas sacchari]|nr:hypothetical protein [Xanthomonas sacchari]